MTLELNSQLGELLRELNKSQWGPLNRLGEGLEESVLELNGGAWEMLPLQVSLGKCGTHTKIQKIKVTMGPESIAGGLQVLKISSPKS